MDGDRLLVERYRERAAELRKLIEDMPPCQERDLLTKIADDYERLTGPDHVLNQANRPYTDS